MLSLYKLEVFNVVAMEGSFSKAAERLLLSQPAVSQHIKDLEASLGTELFTRGNRGVVLTTPGETLLDYTRCILRLLAEAESAIRSIHDISEAQLSIGATPGIGIHLLPTWIQTFRSRHPSALMKLKTDTTSAIAAGIHTGQLDFGFVEGELEARAPLKTIPLSDIELFIMVGPLHRWRDRKSIKVSELAGEPFITRPPGSQTRTWIDHLFNEHGLTQNLIAEFDRPEAIVGAVASGMGITILPVWEDPGQAARKLKPLRIDGIPMLRTIKFVWSEDFPLKPVSLAFLSQLIDQYPLLSNVLPGSQTVDLHLPERGSYQASSSCMDNKASRTLIKGGQDGR
jgi:DNA-binding transcriptional LysR family regulator